MHHLLAYYSSIAASSTAARLNAVEDGQYTISNNSFLLDQKHTLMRTYMLGAGATRGQIIVPSLRAVTLPRIHPVDKNASPQNDPSIIRYGPYGVSFMPAENVSVQADTDATAGPLAAFCLLWITPNYKPAPVGPAFTIKATASVVQTVGLWGRGSMTLENDLPSGNYAVVGMDCQGTNALAMRLRFPGGTMLPGVIAEQAAGEFLTDHQRMGNLGEFGTFNSVQIPTLEVLAFGTTDTQDIYLDLVKVS